MRRFVASSLMLLVPAAIGVAFAERCPSCLDRGRVNKRCEWTGDAAFPIDWNKPAHRQHLIHDAQLAEDLAIRHADAEFNRLYGYEAHGGLIDNGRVVRECMARLVDAIEANHAVTPEQVTIARGQHNLWFDLATACSFVPIYFWGALAVCRRLFRRFAADPPPVRWLAAGLASVVVTFLGLQVGQLWGSVWQAVRVRNGHMSPFRAAIHTLWAHQHVGVLCVVGVALFFVAAATWRRGAVGTATRIAASFTATMLTAMFVDVFVHQVVGCALVAVALFVFQRLLMAAERSADARAPQGVWLH